MTVAAPVTASPPAYSLKCVEMELGEPDASGRRRPIVKEGSEFEMEMDCVIMRNGGK